MTINSPLPGTARKGFFFGGGGSRPPAKGLSLFRFGFTINTAGPITDYVVDLPQAGFGNRNSTTGEREVQWFADLNEPTGSIRGAAEVVPATIILTPGPGALGVLGLGALAGTRRRRDDSRRA